MVDMYIYLIIVVFMEILGCNIWISFWDKEKWVEGEEEF